MELKEKGQFFSVLGSPFSRRKKNYNFGFILGLSLKKGKCAKILQISALHRPEKSKRKVERKKKALRFLYFF